MSILDSLLAETNVQQAGAQQTGAVTDKYMPIQIAPAIALDRDHDEWIDADAKARIEADIARARKAGFATGVPIYAVGTVVNSTGVENARKSRAAFDALPPATTALDRLCATVEAERREDTIVNVNDLRMDVDGSIGLASDDGETRWTLEKDTLGQLASRVTAAFPEEHRPASFGGYLASCPKELRAPNVNAWTERAPSGETAKLRTRLGQGGDRGIFAIVSEKYASVDVDQIARMTREALNGAGVDMRARIDYDGRGCLIDIESHSNVPAEAYAAGEVFRAGVRLTTDDTGGGAIEGCAFIEQNLCRNLIILHTGKANVFRVIHKGNVHGIVYEIRRGIRRALDAARVFADQWKTACHTSIFDMVDVDRSVPGHRAVEEIMAATMASMVARDVLPIGSGNVGNRVRTVVPRLLAQWEEDVREGSAAVYDHSGATRAAVVNAATRYAHRVEQDPWKADAIERAAGRVLAGQEHYRMPTVEEFQSWNTTPEKLVVASAIAKR